MLFIDFCHSVTRKQIRRRNCRGKLAKIKGILKKKSDLCYINTYFLTNKRQISFI